MNSLKPADRSRLEWEIVSLCNQHLSGHRQETSSRNVDFFIPTELRVSASHGTLNSETAPRPEEPAGRQEHSALQEPARGSARCLPGLSASPSPLALARLILIVPERLGGALALVKTWARLVSRVHSSVQPEAELHLRAVPAPVPVQCQPRPSGDLLLHHFVYSLIPFHKVINSSRNRSPQTLFTEAVRYALCPLWYEGFRKKFQPSLVSQERLMPPFFVLHGWILSGQSSYI